MVTPASQGGGPADDGTADVARDMRPNVPTVVTLIVLALFVWWVYFVVTVADRLQVWPW